MNDVKATICDWCLREAPVGIIEEKLWFFWGVISNEYPLKVSLKNICEKCKSRCEEFSTYTTTWRSNESTVMKVLASRELKDDYSIDVKYRPIIKQEIWKEESSDFDHSISVDERKSGIVNMVLPDYTNAESKTSYVCSFCEKHFPNSYRLKVHVRIHTGDKPFACSHCRKGFAQSAHLISHLRLHTGEKPFKCSQCNKTFKGSSALKVHSRVHTGDKPYKCSHCNKTFTQSSTLTSHLRIHTGDKPFKCSQCNKTFIKSFNLKSHMNVHTGNKPFKCLQCKKTFTGSSALKRHMLVHR